MAEEPDNLVLQLLRTMRAENSAHLDSLETGLEDVRQGLKDVAVASFELRFDGLDERVEMIREGHGVRHRLRREREPGTRRTAEADRRSDAPGRKAGGGAVSADARVPASGSRRDGRRAR